MLKFVQVLVLAAAVAHAIPVPTTVDQFHVHEITDSDLEVFEDLKDTTAVCPSVASPCQIGDYLDPNLCICVPCPSGKTSSYSPLKPYKNVGSNSCYACQAPFMVFKCPVLGVFDVCGGKVPAAGLCIIPGNRQYWTVLFQSFGWPSQAVNWIPWLFPNVYNSDFTLKKAYTMNIDQALSHNDDEEGDSDEMMADGENVDDETQVSTVDAQTDVAACSSYGCCPPGSYGKNSGACTVCPQLSTTPYAIPDANCQCPNSLQSNCIPCNKCEVRNAMGQCVPRCGPGEKCSLTVTKQLPPKASIQAGFCYV